MTNVSAKTNKLREVRQAKGLTQTDLALLVGLHYRTIGRIEAGHKPHRIIAKAIARVLKTSPEDLGI